MPKPQLGCGKTDQPPCPPDNAALVKDGVKYYTFEQMQAHGQACYEKGIRDAAEHYPKGDDGPV